MNINEEIYRVVQAIPKGKVLTYGKIASLVGTGARAVGNVLHKNPDVNAIPCHRVVNSKGETAFNYAFGGSVSQRKKLESEGIYFTNNRVDLDIYCVSPDFFNQIGIFV